MRRRTVVTGSSGDVGTTLLRKLAEDGHPYHIAVIRQGSVVMVPAVNSSV
ncbi:hypothetical protein [Mycobacterium paraseoulense]|nr:hypothetical protein [Mycobacterium paraseoulense]MCV7397864.1 hypothetical protein [Mycobacterium paraseoulense]BBZ74272.1 hypothetical protein MPRS_53650 [Mycobacterium paraseoulense]